MTKDASLDKLLQDIQEAIGNYQKGKGARDLTVSGIIKAIEDRPLYDVAVEALREAGGRARAKDLQSILRKNYNKRVSRPSLYMALDYARRRFDTVDRKRGMWLYKDEEERVG